VYDLLKPSEGCTFNVDTVFLNVQNGKDLALVFKRLGVPHIFALESEVPQQEEECLL